MHEFESNPVCTKLGHVYAVVLVTVCQHTGETECESRVFFDNEEGETTRLGETTRSFGPFDSKAAIAAAVADDAGVFARLAIRHAGY